MLTHSEAQALISASLDQPLDPDIEDVLAEHLATCAECRYFAASSQRLASALASLPTVPASRQKTRPYGHNSRRGSIF